MERIGSTGGPIRGDALDWERLIEDCGPAAMIVRIRARMSEGLLRYMAPEDLWQETLLHAWRDRERHEWQGVAAFRGWMMQIAENRIRDAADFEFAQKRGAGRVTVLSQLEQPGTQNSSADIGSAQTSATPSRNAIHSEQAECMREALEALPKELREVVRLRLFEEWALERIGTQLGISVPAVKHRLRKGAERYRERLASTMSSRRSQGKP